MNKFDRRTETAQPLTFWRDEIASGKTSYDLFRTMRTLTGTYGYVFFSIFRMPDTLPAKLSDHLLIANLPPELMRAYDEKGLFCTTSTCQSLAATVEPLIRRVPAAAGPGCGDKDAQLDLVLQEGGVSSYVLFPVRALEGEAGAVMFAGEREDPVQQELLELAYLSNLAFDRLIRECSQARSAGVTLTDRERECLHWTAAGKTSTEIGTILSISVHTVDHYLTTAGQKLGTVNRSHTVATALRKKLIR